MEKAVLFILAAIIFGCQADSPREIPEEIEEIVKLVPEPQFSLSNDQTHNKFSRTIEPILRVPDGAIIEFNTQEATDKQLTIDSKAEDIANVSFEPIHPLTGPVFVEGAAPGDVLAVTFHKIEPGDWGWSAIFPGFGYLSDEFTEPFLKTFKINPGDKRIAFNDKISIPVKPFAGVIGVAPDTDSLLSTIPPRANGGNMDDPNIVEGTTVYLPVFVEGALLSLGDAHTTQGLGEVSGTALESPMRFIVEVKVVKDRKIEEPQYETADYYAVTGFGTTIDEATKKAIEYMIDYLEAHHNLSREEAYVLCSLAGDLKIAEVVDVPHMLVTMHMSKEVLGVK